MANKIEKGKNYICNTNVSLRVKSLLDGTPMGEDAIVKVERGSCLVAPDDGFLIDAYGNMLFCNDELAECFSEAGSQVEHPSHYNQNGIECFDVIKAAIGDVGFKHFCYGNAIKYLFRAKHKGREMEDLEKAMFYLKEIIKND